MDLDSTYQSNKKINVSSVLDLESLAQIFESYHELTGAAVGLIEPGGKILISYGWQRACADFHRKNEITCQRCRQSDSTLAGDLNQGKEYNLYRCQNGLVDVATPIKINGIHVANVFTGQFLLEEPDLEFFARQAQEVGFDEEEYLDAIREVPVFSEAEIKQHLNFLCKLPTVIAKMGLVNLELQSANQELLKHRENLEELIKNRTQELQRAKEIAEEASRTKSNFLAAMSHELRTPLNAIIGFSDLLHHREKDPNRKQYLNSISTSGTTLLELINNVLDITKIESNKMELQLKAVNLRNLLSEIESIFRHSANMKSLELKLSCAALIPDHLMLDKLRLKQILINLVSNAIKFTDEGTVEVFVDATQADAGNLNIEINVSDTGIGIPSDQIEYIFGSFAQALGQDIHMYGGTGLGLALSRELVQLMHGTIKAESKRGDGSKFCVSLPDVVIALEALDDAEREIVDFTKYQFDFARILIADDSSVNRKLLYSFLKNFNFEIIEAADGKEALALARKHAPDLIILDYIMPKLNGLEILQALRSDANFGETPIFLITASSRVHHSQEIRDAFTEYFSKPINIFKLAPKMARYLPHKFDDSQTVEIVEKSAPAVFKEKSESTFHVLIADDAPMNTMLLQRLFETHWRCRVGIASNGMDALEYNRKHQPDLIIMDLHMPVMSGLEATRMIRSGLINTEVLIYSMTAEDPVEMQELYHGIRINGFLTKPIDTKQILDVVDTILSNRRLIP